jgi:hypothetical protein
MAKKHTKDKLLPISRYRWRPRHRAFSPSGVRPGGYMSNRPAIGCCAHDTGPCGLLYLQIDSEARRSFRA